MEKFKPITSETRKSNRRGAIFFGFCGFIIGLVTVFAFIYQVEENIWWLVFFAALSISSFIFSVLIWQQNTEQTEEALKLQKEENEQLLDKWYARYPLAIFSSGLAYLCYVSWLSGNYVSGGLLLFINPIAGILWTIGALMAASELSLILILAGVGYLLYTGISALPVSVAIIVGACVIAYAISRRNQSSRAQKRAPDANLLRILSPLIEALV